MAQDYKQRVLDRAERDDAFRQHLVSDPKAAIAEELGVAIPDDVTIRVVEEPPQEVILLLPARSGPGELDDEQLAAASGGSGDWCGPDTGTLRCFTNTQC
jgi:nitrile hydratase alpha subunit